MLRGAARTWVGTTAQELIALVITTPVADSRVSSATIAAAWTFAATQDQYRAQIFEDEDGETLVWDSEWTASGTQSANLATAGVLTSNRIYYLKLYAHGTGGEEAESELVAFYFALSTSVDIVGLRARPLPKCDPSPLDLPGILLTWTQPVPAETFLAYEIQRREAGTSNAYDRIKRITSISTTRYLDVDASPGVEYEYVVLFYGDDATPATLLSSPQSPPVRARVDFDWIYIHEVNEPARFFQIASYEGRTEPQLDLALAQAWGQTKPTAFVGEAAWHSLTLPGLDRVRSNPRLWRAMRDMYTRQSTAPSTLCIRYGRDRERYFVAMTRLAKSLSVKSYSEILEFVEVEHNEDIGLYEHTPGGQP